MTMNTITESDLLAISGGNFAHDAGYVIGATASWICAIGGLQCGMPGMFAEKVSAIIYL
jgi:hypothetical protein